MGWGVAVDIIFALLAILLAAAAGILAVNRALAGRWVWRLPDPRRPGAPLE